MLEHLEPQFGLEIRRAHILAAERRLIDREVEVAVDLKSGLRLDHLLQSGIAYLKSQTIGFIEHKLLIDQLLERLFANVVARQGLGGLGSVDLFQLAAQLLGLLIDILS